MPVVADPERARWFRESVAKLVVDPASEEARVVEAGGALLVSVDRRSKPYCDQSITESTRVGRRRTMAVRGYHTSGNGFSDVAGWKRRGGSPQLAESPGGVYSAIVIDHRDRTLFAWTSHGNVEAVFYARTDDAVICGTNPLAVHALARGDGTVRLDPDWIRHTIVPNSTMYDDTPFVGVRYVPARRCLAIREGRIDFVDHPVEIPTERFDATLDELLVEAERAVSVAAMHESSILSLSGGKDSRAVLGALTSAGIRIPSFTSGVPGNLDVDVARLVADAAGIEHVVRTPSTVSDDEVWDVVTANLRRSDGLLNENRHLVVPVQPERVDVVEVHGQAHHLRGGYMSRGNYGRGDGVVDAVIGKFSSGRAFCRPELGADVDRLAREYVRRPDVGRKGSPLFWVYGDLRMARWLQSGFHGLRKHRLLVWPFLDERVIDVAARLPVHDRVHEIAQYELIARSLPEVAALPLADSRWRFDGRGIEVHPEFAAARSAPPLRQPAPGGRRSPAPGGSVESVLPFVREALHDFAAGALVRDLLDPVVLGAIDGTSPLADALELKGRFPLFSFLWRLIALSSVHEGIWLPPHLRRVA